MHVSSSNEVEIAKGYDPRDAESRWYSVWTERGYFRAQDESEKEPFCIVIPPPNITGALHMGHAVFVTLQDLLARWQRMSGKNVLWLPGTDHAGIATQLVVERELRKQENKTRHDLGREEFLRRVWAWKEKYGGRITEQLRVMGASCDWDRERFTMDEGLTRAVREAFVRLHEQGLIYRAARLINWCPRCRTALSDLEVEHEERQGKLWHIAYPVKGSDTRLCVATTRPETMLGDTAVAVHPEDPRYRALIGKRVVLPLVGREIPIIGDAELVSMEFGTGAVKVTPAHDFNDYATGLRHGLATISIFDLAAKTNEHAGPYRGLDRAVARERVLEDLAEQGFLVETKDHALSLGLCQRCNDVVEPTLSPQWFVKVKPLAERALAAVADGRTRFVPEGWTNTFNAWMRNIHDWCISRQLWWGHQIPAWHCACGEVVVARAAPVECPRCKGRELKQDEDVLDTWFSSALWPFSTLGWPERTRALATFYPTSVMETGHDIIFFWVARMMMFGLHFMDDVPFRVVFLHAMVRDDKGEKMSKVKENVIDPLDVIRGQPDPNLLPRELRKKFGKGMPAFGADALRFTLASLTAQGRDIKLSMDVVEGYKNFANKIWNASRFALMNLGSAPEAGEALGEHPLSIADRWILSRLNSAVKETVDALEGYRFSDAARAIYHFAWYELCDWYLELSKVSLYGTNEAARATTRQVLLLVLDQLLKLLHPFMPFLTEEIWQKLPRGPGAPASIMIAPYPSADSPRRDEEAERAMEMVIEAIEGIRSIRGETGISPAKKIGVIVHAAGAEVRALMGQHRSYVEHLAGVSSLEVSEPGPRPRVCSTSVGPHMEIFVPLEGLIDLAEEEKRIQKEIAKGDADLALLTGRLENPSFVERAPKEIVEKDRARIAELRERRAKLAGSLSLLMGEGRALEADSSLPAAAVHGGADPAAIRDDPLTSPGHTESKGAQRQSEGEGRASTDGVPAIDPPSVDAKADARSRKKKPSAGAAPSKKRGRAQQARRRAKPRAKKKPSSRKPRPRGKGAPAKAPRKPVRKGASKAKRAPRSPPARRRGAPKKKVAGKAAGRRRSGRNRSRAAKMR